jgi:hypothetical protein
MREMSLQRRRVVALAGSIAAMSGAGPLLLRGHRHLGMAWIGFVAVMLVVVIVQMVKLRREEGR